MKKIKIGLVEIGDSFGGQYYFPYSLGVLRAYAQKHLPAEGNFEFLPIIYKRGNIQNYVEHLSEADIIFYSAYLWNFQASLDMAQALKKKKPAIINVFGGPNVPESKEKIFTFLGKYPFVDIASFGEGERPFLRIIENCQGTEWNTVPSIGWRHADSTVAFNEFKETIEDINEIPSPYLSGVFDELIEQNPQEVWQGRIETNRGCPFTCAFCYWGKKSERKLRQFDLNRVYGEIDWLSKNKIEFVFCCDANFGIFKRDFSIAKKVADNKAAFGYPKAFSVQNTKNSKERIFELQKILNDAGLQKGVNLALQSLNKETLRCIERSNIDNQTYAELQKLFTQSNIPTFTDLIVGLPGESYKSFTAGVAEIIASGQHNRIQFINLTILENTLMAQNVYQTEHGLALVEAELTAHHSSLDTAIGVKETQYLVTATRSMPAPDWVKTRVFSWLASLLHFDKLLQIPFIILHELGNISYKSVIEIFMQTDDKKSILAEILSTFENKAAAIQAGGSEYSESKEWLNISWYPDEWILIKMSTEGKLEEFYNESEKRLLRFNNQQAIKLDENLISSAIHFNQLLLKQPFLNEDIMFKSNYNIWEIYQAALRGQHAKLEKNNFDYVIDRTSQQWSSREDWCREVIWYGNKKGDYIYSVQRSKQ
ncbi:MAG: B12-binding domain-containing radical SAM protein [Smithellaceae bacterium]